LYQDRYWHEADFAAVEELHSIAREAGETLVQLALRWLLSHRLVTSIILGASRLEQLQENLKAAEGGPLDPSVLARCDEVWKRLRGVTPKYNR
jgi:aryl-alcohol dehydrogenase-like predicted oxidoreductase